MIPLSKKNLISIIIPLYNRENLISETIESVFIQSYSNWEIIIVDDGSTDNSMEIINTFAKNNEKIKIFQRERLPKGASTCRNIGAENANGEYLIFLDSDDLLAPFCLEQRIKIMQENLNLDFAVFNMFLFRNQLNDLNTIFNLKIKNKDTYLKMFLRDTPPWQTMCVIWRKLMFLKINGFDEIFWIMDDPELHTRALLEPNVNYNFLEESKPDCYYRIGHIGHEMNLDFIKKSIVGRLDYFKKSFDNISSSNISVKEKKDLIKNLNKGIKVLFSEWLFSRISTFNEEYNRLMFFCKNNNILSNYDLFVINLNKCLWLNDNKIIRFLKLKGIFKILITK